MNTKSKSKWKEILFLAGVVLLFRIFYVEILNYLKADYQYNFPDLLHTIFKEYPATLVMVVLGFFSMHYINKLYSWGENPLRRTILTFVALISISVIITLMLCVPKLGHYSWNELILSGDVEAVFVVSLMANAVIMGVTDVTLYYRKSHKKELDAEIIKKNRARFQYDQLKRQLNPHFLFNSLNVLDYLVHTDANRASDFIKKLAGVYRYLLSKESDPTVNLEEEIEFSNMYSELLKERFDKGLFINIDIEKKYLTTHVIPCSLQLLIENATKHNIISGEMPLTIKIYIQNNQICIENNRQLRIKADESTGLGLKSIEVQYQTLFNKSIQIEQTEKSYVVRLPLIEHI
ncbi:MAG: histidine kinase [Bacteroidales bacterium]|nr:histidine kinase [Bacteroidales bacterium]